MTGTRRHAIVHWLRRVHGWIGLWGAVLGLLFGVTGVLLNHRALMNLPAARAQEHTQQLAVPRPAPGGATAMANWVRGELALGGGTSTSTPGARRARTPGSVEPRADPARALDGDDRDAEHELSGRVLGRQRIHRAARLAAAPQRI